MARLIPRKQIEEQQNITGSLTIGQNVFVGNDAIITGSIFVSQSFFFGSSTASRNEITGSVFLTGSLTIDGQLRTSAPNTVLAVTSSNAILSVDTQRYAGILAKDFGANLPTLYVSSTDGDDTNDGRSIQYPLRTIKRAAQLATPGYDGRYGFDTGSRYNGYVIKVQAGTYLEDNPVVLPSNTTIWGAGLRITKINAKNPTEDLFWVNSGCYVAEVTVGGLRLYPDQINPEKGFGFAFQPGAFITTSPYIQNCSQISNQENSFTELYEDIPPGGGGLYVNGDVINPDSPLASMVLDAYTQISPNGVGCLVNGRGFIQLVSFFNNFSYYAIRVNNGGHATLNNSNISFGLYGMYASGSRLISGSGGNTDARDRVRASYSVIVDVLNKGLEEGLPSITKLNTDEGIKVTSASQYFTSAEKSAPQFISDEISAEFKLVSAIVETGTANYPTLLARSSNKGYGFESPYNILGANQITSSISASVNDLNHISQSYGVILGIFANGTGSYTFKSNTEDNIQVTNNSIVSPVITASDYVTGSVSSSFETIISILRSGVSAIPKVVSNNSASIKVTDFEQFTTGESSSLATINSISSSFSIVYNIIENGTGSAILDVPVNHKTSFVVTNTNSSSYNFEGLGENPTLTLFRGFTYKFYVSASEAVGGVNYPFWIRTKKVSGIDNLYDYGSGVVNNGDSVGNITFTVPYDAPNKLYYVSSKNENLAGEFSVVNSSVTPTDLIAKTLTYPPLVSGSTIASEDVNILNAYDQLIGNKAFIQEETIAFISSSWSGFSYDQTKCKRDVGYIIDAVANDLLYGGNDKSITAGRYYYEYPSNATTSELAPTLTAVKYASGLAQTVVGNIQLVDPSNEKDSISQCIVDNREFVQSETIAFLSSSWSGGDGFYYNEEKCKRDVGYILDAVATDLKYGGNERSIQAGYFYYKYPSAATVAGVPSSTNQLEQTLTGIRYAAGVVKGLIYGNTFVTASQSTQAAVDLLRKNKVLIQNETIQFINVAYPQLKYNTAKCRRDVGYIVDAIITDLLYGGNERSATAGHNYYNYPSIATSTQKKETSGGIRYSKIISDYIVQNIILDTPKIVNNDEKGIKVTEYNNVTSSFSGTDAESYLISSSFNIVEGIIKRGVEAIPSILAKSTNTNWGINNPLNVTNNTQFINEYVTPNEVDRIDTGFNIVTSIIAGGLAAEPVFTSSLNGLIKVTNNIQTTGSGATNSETASISSSFGYIEDIIINGTGSIQSFVLNTDDNIKVTSTSLVSGTPATIYQFDFVSSSMGTIVDIITNGLNVIPSLIDNTQNNISVSGTSQYTNLLSANPEDITFISQSISIVTNIIEYGEGVSPAYVGYTTSTSDANTLAAYDILTNNIQFIQDETIAYLSSSWSGFEYDESLCRRDIGYIINAAAEDLIHNANSASLTSGLAYYEFPSQATGFQLAQTLEGINYASKLAQKLVQNITLSPTLTDNQNAASLLKDNKVFIQNETIAYMSSSWGSFDYNEAKCRRDIGYIIDAVATDIVYGGNERTIEAGRYYYLYPSQANTTQLQQTNDAISYASRIAQKIVVGQTFTSANTNELNASNLLAANRSLIAEEVVAYVSSSWSGVFYNEAKCKRDVGYLIDAVRTDLVYGGNERSSTAGLYYYLYPSSATVAGIPSTTAQLDPTITGISYGSRLAQNIILNKTLVAPSEAVLDARELVKANTQFIQQNTIDYISETYPNLDYNASKCYRDVKFIIDGVLTDMVYGGNERSITSGEFYYLYPNLATTKDQVSETVDALNFSKELTKLIATEGIAIENGFDNIINIIASASYSAIVTNTNDGIKATDLIQYTSSIIANEQDFEIVSSSFGNVINIISNGTGSIPTIISSSFKGVNVTGGNQITSSIKPNDVEIQKVGNTFDVVIDIIENGLAVLPTLVTNATGSIKVTDFAQYTSSASIPNTLISNVNSDFDIILNIIESGTGSLPNLVKNVNSLVKLTDTPQYSSSIAVSASKANYTTGSFDRVINIVTNGTGSLPTKVLNSFNNIKVSSTTQYIGTGSGTPTQSTYISSSISLVADIVGNGTGSMLSAIPYVSKSTNSDVIDAYNILKQNIPFIQSETIAYLSSSWAGFDYNETKCKRDIGYIINGAAEDLLWNSNSSSLNNGYYYYKYPSEAETTQLNQTLDGIKYASALAQKVVLNTLFNEASNQNKEAYSLLVNNKKFIQNETIAYISSSWTVSSNSDVPFIYNEASCSRDVAYIIDAAATDLLYGGNERSIEAGYFYYKYPSQATDAQLDPTITGIRYASNLTNKLIKGAIFQKVSQNKLFAKDLIINNKELISNEVVAFVSHSWNGFQYNENKCKRDVGYILDAVATDMIYGGNERSIEAGYFYYKYPSNATGAELAPTLSGIRYAKGLTEVLVKNIKLVKPKQSNQIAYDLLAANRELIQNETIEFVNSAWSFFNYNESKCRRDVGYMVDAAATDILYGGNERAREAGRYYYLYPSLATVGGDGDSAGQLGQTLDGVRYAKGIAQKIVSNALLQTPTQSELAGYDLLLNNKPLIQAETIAYLSSSWSGIGDFSYNQASCSRDVAYIVDNVATDLLYGGNERSSKAGEYYYLYPSKAVAKGLISPTTDSQKGPTIDGVKFAAGIAGNLITGVELIKPTEYVQSAVSLLKQNKTLIQDETIQFVDAFYPNLRYAKAKCRRDVGYIIDAISTDLFYGGNERSIIAGDYYYRYPNLATTKFQVNETVGAIKYAKALAKKVAQNIELQSPLFVSNTDSNIKATNTNQYTSSISVSTTEISKISSSFSIVTNIINGGVQVAPTKVLNTNSAIKITNETPITSSINGGSVYADLVTSSFNLVRDIIYYGENGTPDALARNYNYGFELQTPSLLHISSTEQSTTNVINYTIDYTPLISSSYATIIDIVNNGTGSIPTIIENTSSSIYFGSAPYQSILAGTTADINKIGGGFEVVMSIIEGTYPTLISNTNAGIKVTNTPQLISGSGAERLQAKLISSSIALVVDIVINGTGSQQFVSSSYPNANTNPKVQSAYNLLLGNKQMIIDETIAYMSSSWSTFEYNEASCSRDLGYIIDAAAFDLIYNGNSASYECGKYYYDFPSQATDSQLDQTVTALKYASGISEKVVKNIVLTHISASQETSASYSSLLTNKEFIKGEVIQYVNLSWSSPNFIYNQDSCSRDIGYIVDAVATDLLYGGNERSIVAGDYYYKYPSVAITSQLQSTLDGVNYAKGLAMNVANNTTFTQFGTDIDLATSAEVLFDNKEFIQNETISFVNAKYPNLYYDQTKCRRDVGYIVDAVLVDLIYGGNQRAATAGEFYYKYPSIATDVQLVETTAAIDYTRRLSEEVINGNLIPTPEVISNTFNNIKVTNVPQYVSASSATAYEVNRVSSSFSIVNTIIQNGLLATPTLVSNVSESVYVTSTPQISGIAATQTEADYISSSISIVTDIIQNGTGSIPVLTPYGAASTDPNVINAYNNLINNISFIQSETIAYISSSWSFFNYNEASCSRDVAYIVNGAAEDLLYNSTSASFMNGYYYFLFPSNATLVGDGDGIGQLGQTLDGVNYASRLAQQIVLGTTFVSPSTERKVASELLKLNKSFIAAETVAYISSSWVTGSNSDVAFTYNDLSCSRDVNYILDNVATDILYGGNERTIKAGSYYFLYPSQATGSQIDETLEGIKYAGELAQKVVLNTIFTQPNITASAVYEALKANKPFIQAETIAYVTSSWVGLEYNEAKCKRDVGYIVDAVATDILYGGNQRSATAGQYYFKYPSQATGSQIDSTLNAIDFAGGTANNVITNIAFVTASQSVSASVELLRNNRGFIQNETMAWLNSAWSFFNYNQEKCKRDVGYIIDGIATDILYGGNERSVMSGEFYFKYPSKATLLGNGQSAGQLTQTTEGINYASRITQKVVQNTLFHTASIAVSASVDLLRKNKDFIAAETIAYVSSSWSTVYYNEASCSRDVRYIIDATATDVLYGGTERAITAGTYYYTFPSKATKAGVPSEANQLDPTITGVKYAGRLATGIIKNPTFTQVSTDALNSRDLLVGNKTFIQKETIAFLSSSWSTLKYNEVSCSRDLGFIIDAVATDIVYGGNERAIQAGSYYYYIPSVAIADSYTDNGTVGQKMQTLDGINFARGVAEKAVTQTQLVFPGKKRKEAVARLLAAKDELKKKAIGYTNGAFPYLVYNEASCSRDTGLIVDALATDLTYGGNERGIRAAESYWKGQYGSAAAVVTTQKLETLETNRYLRTRAEFIAAGAPLEPFGSLIVATGIDYSYNGAGVTFKALPPNQGGSGVANPIYEITQLAGGRIFFTSGNQDGDFRIGTGLSINQATGTLVGRTFSKSLFTLVTPFSLALQI
jgi:hypothetical protein